MTRASAFAGVPVLVPGGNGFIGRWVVRALHARGANVTVVARDEQIARAAFEREHLRVQVIADDLSQPGRGAAVVRRAAPAVVFNLAVHGVDHRERDASLMERLNAALPLELCRALLSTPAAGWEGVRLIHTGSALEYGNVSGMLSEDVTPVPTTAYGRTKLAGTIGVAECSQAEGLRSITARLFTVYGPGEHDGRLLPSILRLAGMTASLPLTAGNQRRDFTYVEDVAEGLLRLALSDADPGAIVNLATGRLTRVREFAEIAVAVAGIDPARLEFGALPTREEEMHHDEVLVNRLERLTGWRPPTTVREGIARSWDWEHVRA